MKEIPIYLSHNDPNNVQHMLQQDRWSPPCSQKSNEFHNIVPAQITTREFHYDERL